MPKDPQAAESSREAPEPRPSYGWGTWLFLRGLGLVYLVAFLSLWVQIEGLIGSQGILPVADYFEWLRERTDVGFLQLPSVLWWVNGDGMLHVLCGAGVVLSGMLMAGFAQGPALVLLWVCYLSLVLGGQAFLSFQWDTLLLESGLCALFVAPWRWRPQGPRDPSRVGLIVIWFLLFKLMFLSGVVKPLCQDETWWQLTALEYHYWTQPIPTWTSWYAHQLPSGIDKLSIWITYVIEIGFPFLILLGAWGRRTMAAGTVFLMLMISWTGNYGFFNLLTMVLCLPLLDDAVFARLPGRIRPPAAIRRERSRSRPKNLLLACIAGGVLVISAQTLVWEMVRTVPAGTESLQGFVDSANQWILPWGQPTLDKIAPFRSINGYGLFRSMTTERPEIEIQGSVDGRNWVPYPFKWKPGDVERPPTFIGPHMPRLDWQMWFAALGPQRAQNWLAGLMRGLLEGSPPVIALLDEDPFSDQPPRYVRLMYYRYRFADPAEKEQGRWWSREEVGPLTGALSLDQLAR